MYFVLVEDYDETHVLIDDSAADIPKQYQLLKGISRQNGWPDDVVFRFSDNRAEGMFLTDWVNNESGWLVISDRFKKLVEAFPVPDIEFLPVKINNHKGRLASDSYWIGNFLMLTEAVDREQSDFKEDRGNKGQIRHFDKLVVRKGTLQEGPPMFRLKESPDMVLAREDLVKALESKRLTGMKFVDTSEFNSDL